jgi:hypothetical protein
MRKSREEMVQLISMMESEMIPILKEAKIKDNHLSLIEETAKLPREMITEGYKWLEAIYENEFAAVKTVKRLLPDILWERYRAWEGFDEHQEVKLLREKMIPFRAVIVSRNRPNLFKKGKVNAALKKLHSKKRRKSSAS